MTSKGQAWILLLLSLSSIINSSLATCDDTAGGIAIYWGQNSGEGTLTATCDTKNYDTVVLSFLNVFGCDKTPEWNFAGHCGGWDPCTKLQSEIKHCQEKGVKIFLSLGGANSICSAKDAKNVAKYLYDNFLSGQHGPLGSVALDGISFDVEGGSILHWDDLAKELDTIRTKQRYFLLSASPQCFIPDYYLDTAIKTGLFDHVYVRFFNNPPCQYSNGNTARLFESWKEWTSLANNSAVFLGLPAAPEVSPTGGYIPTEDLVSEVLPYVKQTPNYGGVALWDRFRDVQSLYSNKIKYSIPVRMLHTVSAISNAISKCVAAALGGSISLPKSAAL